MLNVRLQSARHPGMQCLLGGIGFLIVAMGVGRFAYTSMLPPMQEAFGFGDAIGGALASANYAGYLLGAVVGGLVSARMRAPVFRWSLAFSLLSTLLMAFPLGVLWWAGLRFVAGLASALVFVCGSVLAIERMTALGAGAHAGKIYAGVGIGIALAALAVPPLVEGVGVSGAWVGLAALSLVPIAMSLRWVRPLDVSAASERDRHARSAAAAAPGLPPALLRLGIAYFLEGAGYAVSATFLVRIVADLPGGSALSGDAAWVLVGLAAAISSLIWPAVAAGVGFARALLRAHLLQSVGIVLPVLLPGALGAYCGALLFGGTFMGIVGMSLMYARSIAPQSAGRSVGVLTALFGLGQIIAPVLAGVAAERSGSFALPLWCAAGLVFAGALLLWVDARRPVSRRA